MNTKKIYDHLYKNFVPKTKFDQLRHPDLVSIKHSGGYIFASDGMLLAKIECKYPSDLEGKAINRAGEEIENSTPYESVIYRPCEMDLDITNLLSDLKTGAKKVYKLGRGKNKAVIDAGITKIDSDIDYKVTFQANQLFAAFQLFDLLKEDFKLWICNPDIKWITFSSLVSNTLIQIYPVYMGYITYEYDRPVFTIEEAKNYQQNKIRRENPFN